MRPSDIGALIDVGSPRLSPDGRTVVVAVTGVDVDQNRYTGRLWLVPVDASAPPRPLTPADGRDGTPRWSPDGTRVAYVAHPTDERAEVRVVTVDGGDPVTLVGWDEDIDELAWSPDGSRLAFAARRREPGRSRDDKERDQEPRRIERLLYRTDDEGWTVGRRRHVFVVPAEGGDAQPVTSGDVENGYPAWSPDGTQLAFTSGRHESWDVDLAADIFTVGAAGGAPTRRTETGPTYGHPSWRADGGAIAFNVEDLSTAPHHGQVGVLDLATGEARLLTTALDRNCLPHGAAREPVWAGDDLLFVVEDCGNMHLYRVAADGSSAPRPIVTGDRQVTGFDAGGEVVAFTSTTATTLAELFVSVGGEERQLTRFGEDFTSAVAVAAPQRFTAVSADGTEVETWFLPPVGAQPGERYPLLLNVHGGPFSQYGNRFFDEFQVQAGAGYAVVYANPRGSSGYSEAWGRAIRSPKASEDPGSGWGGVDYEDLMAVVEEAVRRFDDVIDPERVGMLGGSYGGYMAVWMVSHTDRFRSACSERSCNNLLTMCWTSDFPTAFRSDLGIDHLVDPEEYLRMSPVTYLDRIHTPLLILHSEDDLRCPISQAEELFVALRLLGREVEFWRFPGEGHELSRSGAPRHRIRRAELILDWFDRTLR